MVAALSAAVRATGLAFNAAQDQYTAALAAAAAFAVHALARRTPGFIALSLERESDSDDEGGFVTSVSVRVNIDEEANAAALASVVDDDDDTNLLDSDEAHDRITTVLNDYGVGADEWGDSVTLADLERLAAEAANGAALLGLAVNAGDAAEDGR